DVLAIDDVGEAVGAGDRADDDAAAIAAVAAVGAALGNVLLAPEAAAAAAAVAALDEDGDSIDEHYGFLERARIGLLYQMRCARDWFAGLRLAFAWRRANAKREPESIRVPIDEPVPHRQE